MITQTTPSDPSIAEQIHEVAEAAYTLEAELIGCTDFPPLRESLEELRQCSDSFLVFHRSGRIVAALSFDRGHELVTITRLVVSPAHLRQGIATALLAELEGRCAAMADLTVVTAPANTPAVSLYQRLGYAAAGVTISAEGISLLRLNKSNVRYVAEPTHVREVSLLGTADLAFWTTRLAGENFLPATRGGRARIMIVAAEMRFMGIRFTEVSFSVPVVVPGHEERDAVFLVHAFNSSRLFAFCERRLFATPYSHADCRLSVSPCPSIRIIMGGGTEFLAEMQTGCAASTRKPSRCGDDGWEGPIFLPENRRGRGGDARLFFGRIKGHARAFPFAPSADVVSIRSFRERDVLQALIDSGFTVEEWVVRADATHGKSKTYRKSEIFGR